MQNVPGRRPRADTGFTLIDVLVTVLFLGIVTAIAIPGLQGFASTMKLGEGTRDVERELQTARLKAVTANTAMRVRFDCPGAGQYRMVELLGTPTVPDANDSVPARCTQGSYPYPPADQDLLTRPNNDGPARELPEGVSFGTAATLEFWPDGTVHQQVAGETPWAAVPADVGTTVTLTKDSVVKTITVNGLGKIQLQQ